MSKIPKRLSALVIGMLIATALIAGEATTVGTSTETPTKQEVPSIVQRRAALPTGWFKPGGARSIEIPTDSEVRPAAHFDATGETDDASSRVKQRLRRVRDAAVYENLEQPQPAAETTTPSRPGTGATSRSSVSQPSTTGSSRRRAPARPNQASSPVPAAATAESDASPSQPSSETSPATGGATNSTPALASPTGRPEVAQSVLSGQPTPADSAGTETNNVSPILESTTVPRVDSGADLNASLDSVSSELELPLAPAIESAPTPRTDAQRAGTNSPSDNSLGTPTESAVSSQTLNQLPSVMKPTGSDENSDGGSMTLTPISSSADEQEPQQPTEAVPTAELASRPERRMDDEAILIRNESPLLSVVTRGPKSLVVGKPATYAFDLKNSGDVGAKDVVVHVRIPDSVEVVRQHPSTGTAHIHPDDTGRSVLAWRVDQLEGNGGEKLLLELIPRSSRPLDLGVTWNFTPSQSSAQIQVREPKLQLNVIGPQDVLYGETKVYSITVSNPGTGDAENVVLHLLPLVAGERQAAIRNLGTVPAGTRQTMEVELTARQTGQLQVRAEATADGGLKAQGKQEVLVRRGRLAVTVEGPPMKYAGTRARYAIRVRNTGDAPASQVAVVANVPGGATHVASSDGGTLDPTSGQVEWHVGVLRPGASRVFELECMLMSAGENRIDVRSTATGELSAVGSTATDVESLADLKLTVNDPQGAIAVGADVAYEVRIRNRGTKAAQNVQIFGYFSSGIEPVRIAGWRGEMNEGEVVLQAIPRLGPGQEMVVKITAQASRPGDHVFRAELECNDPETKLAVEEWTRFYGDDRPSQTARRKPKPAPAKQIKLQRY